MILTLDAIRCPLVLESRQKLKTVLSTFIPLFR